MNPETGSTESTETGKLGGGIQVSIIKKSILAQSFTQINSINLEWPHMSEIMVISTHGL